MKITIPFTILLATLTCYSAFCGEIHDAAALGNLEKVKKLLKAHPELVNSRDEHGNTPLHWAASEGHKNVAELLLTNGADVNAINKLGVNSPAQLAIEYGHYDVAELIDGIPEIVRQAEVGNLARIKVLIAGGVDVNAKAKNNIGETALMALTKAAWNSRDSDYLLANVKTLIAAGANPNAKDNVGKATLTRFVEQDALRCVSNLILAGANIKDVPQLIVDVDAQPLSQNELKQIDVLRAGVERIAKSHDIKDTQITVHVAKVSSFYISDSNNSRFLYDGHRLTVTVGWHSGSVFASFATDFPKTKAINPETKSGYANNVASGFIPPLIDIERILREFDAAKPN